MSDDVLQVEQVGVLRRDHQQPSRVDQLPADVVTLGERDQGAAQP